MASLGAESREKEIVFVSPGAVFMVLEPRMTSGMRARSKMRTVTERGRLRMRAKEVRKRVVGQRGWAAMWDVLDIFAAWLLFAWVWGLLLLVLLLPECENKDEKEIGIVLGTRDKEGKKSTKAEQGNVYKRCARGNTVFVSHFFVSAAGPVSFIRTSKVRPYTDGVEGCEGPE